MNPQSYLDFVRQDEQQNFNALIEVYKNNQLIPYVGAGFSMVFNDEYACPSWKGFLESLFEANKKDMLASEKTDFERYFNVNNYEMALDVLVDALTTNEFYKQVEATFDKPKNKDMPAGFSDKFSLFHQVFTGPWLTTNLDRFIEDTCPQGAAYITSIWGYSDGRLADNLNRGDLSGYLFKLHGDAKDKKDMVFAHKQYVSAYGDEQGFDIKQPLPQAFKQLFCNNSLLFIGCSLTIDRPLKILQHFVKPENGGVKPQFALLLRSDWCGEDEESILKRRQLKALNITPIYLDDFTDINQVFEALLVATGKAQLTNLDVEEPDIFVGREAELKALTDNIKQAGSVTTITAPVLNHLQGHGGIGKTTLARKVLSECSEWFEASFEIRVDSIDPMAFAKELAARLGHTGIEFNTNEQARSFINQTLNQRHLLILLDNVDSCKVLLELLPQQYKSCLIVTSRDNELKKLVKLKRKKLALHAIELDKFTELEAKALFKELLEDDYQTDDEATYLAIAEKVDYLPIALRLAITTMIFGDQLTAQELLNQLEQNRYLVLSEQASKLDINLQERSILAVFDLSTPLLTQELKYCLALLAVCEQGPVPEDFLVALHQQMVSSTDLGFMLTDEEFISHIRQLARYSWCKRVRVDDYHHYELHQIVRQVVTSELVDENIERQFVSTVHLNFITEPLHFSVLDRWINQTDKAVWWFKETKDERLKCWAGDFYHLCVIRGYGERLIRYCQWSLEAFKDDKLLKTIALGNQAMILADKGKLNEALKLHQIEQEICESLGDLAGLSICLGNQATILSTKGLFNEAFELHLKEEAIAKSLGFKLQLSKSYCGQSLILRAIGKLDEAIELQLKELSICESLGDQQGVSRSLGNQAVILQMKGEFDEALELLEKAKVIADKLGDKAAISRFYGNKAIISIAKGLLADGLELLQKQFLICDFLGDKDSMAISLINQSAIYEKWNDLSKAIDLCEQAIKLYQECGIPTTDFEKWLVECKSKAPHC